MFRSACLAALALGVTALPASAGIRIENGIRMENGIRIENGIRMENGVEVQGANHAGQPLLRAVVLPNGTALHVLPF